MWKRNSMVRIINITNIVFSSILEIGDTVQTRGFSRALADHRKEEIFLGNEGNFDAYAIFSETPSMPPLPELPRIEKYNALPNIQVRSIKIMGLSASAITQIGNTRNVSMDSRVHHIRHLPAEILNEEEGE
ncbi:hypothetical protein J14TS2_45350 [Bacillus sp. J14TS2]|uniref:spore germination protein GerPE n=1 Tax=Bacillus sp. J14TS2 TaxID=2807188 RepID=UPI001B1A168B|nr:spore germination protein GerPE [Bacillus sp. J14TS2]GIN74060.1 hypothetical protein J14TS2_45350 [Bacillus sp. J14TS2]